MDLQFLWFYELFGVLVVFWLYGSSSPITPHGSENRIPELMTMLRSYGKVASGSIPELRALIAALNMQVAKNKFPASLNKLRVKAVEETIKYLQETTDTPQLKTIKGLDLSTHNPNLQKEESRIRTNC